MNKLTPEHLSRDAYVYVRQSTPDQLLNNPESRRRQYALETRARSLGWENVIVIDDDLGRSGGGAARPGFERLLAAICAGTAGAVFAIEASRLARNGRDWHTLLEFCVVVNSLIIDEDGIYDPRSVNDRLLLGLKGTFSELELSLFRQRSQEALRLKAARGELNTTVAIGYRRGADDRLEGIVMLVGIVKKNAIMMIDFALQRRAVGRSAEEAIREACLLRFRPIMMTSLAAIFGALPIALGAGAGAELRQPLGIAVVGGLLVSQLLTLYITPSRQGRPCAQAPPNASFSRLVGVVLLDNRIETSGSMGAKNRASPLEPNHLTEAPSIWTSLASIRG